MPATTSLPRCISIPTSTSNDDDSSATMFAARQRTSCLARQLQRASRNYASDAHAHHKPAEVNESFGVCTKLPPGPLPSPATKPN